MKAYIKLLFVLIFVHVIICDKSSGLNIGFRNNFFKQVSLDIVQSIVNVLSHIKIYNYTTKRNLGIVNFTLHADYANITNIQIDNNAGLSLNNGIIFKVPNFSVEFVTKLEFYTIPKLFFGNGTVHLKIDNIGNDVELQITADESQNIHINFTKIEFTLSEKQILFESAGSNDIFVATQMGYNWAIPIVINALRYPIQESFRNAISNTLNNLIKSTFRKIKLMGGNIFMDISLLDNCQVIDDRFMLYLNGTVYSNWTDSEKKPIHYNPPINIPDMNSNGKAVQIIVTNYTLNTLFQAMYIDDLLIFKISKNMNPESKFNLDTNLIGVFIPQIFEVYGYKKPIEILIEVIDTPQVFLSSRKFELNLKLSIAISVNDSQGKPESVLKVESDIYFPLNIYLKKGVMFGNTTSYTFSSKLVDHSPSLNIKNITNIDLFINTILQMILPQVNSILSYGKGLNMTKYGFDFTDTIFNIYNNYIEIGSNPVISKKKIEDIVVDSIIQFKKELSQKHNQDINLLLNDEIL